MNNIILNSQKTVEITVENKHLASTVESGSLDVFATPMMIALMEKAAAQCLNEFLEEGETSVGTEIKVSHLDATPLGMKVKATAKITAVEGRRIDFTVLAFDEVRKIGEGTHSRFVVNSEKFMTKTNSKFKV